MTTGRARLVHGLLPYLEVALRVVGAAVERPRALLLGADLDDVARALGARHAERHGLGVLALRITAAGQELAVTTGLDDHRLFALVADVVRHSVHGGLAVFLGQIASEFTLGVRFAAEEE